MFQPSVVQDFYAKGRSYEAHPQGLARPFFWPDEGLIAGYPSWMVKIMEHPI
jgi:hypothetical protein